MLQCRFGNGFQSLFVPNERFLKNNGLHYVEGEIHLIKGIDPNRWSYFETMEIVKDFKYDGDFKLWWEGSK